MLELVEHISRRLKELPRDRKNYGPAREVLMNAKSILEVVETAGYKLDTVESKFLGDIPPLIGGALRGAILDSIEPSNRSRINFDVAYLAGGTGYSLTISAPKRTGEIDVVLQAPAPEREAGRMRRAPSARARAKGARARRRPSR